MSRFRCSVLSVALMASVALAGCGGSSNPTPTLPSAPTTTDVFSGHLVQGGTDFGADNANHFKVTNPGNITVTITQLSPLSTITVGIGLGFYDTGAATCEVDVAYPSGKLNTPVSTPISGAAEICVAIYDVGNLTDTQPIDYEVSVTHT